MYLQFRGSMRPVALSLASGSVSSLLVAVARDLARTNWEHPIVPDICPLVLPEDRPFVDLKSVILGFCLGLFAGPFIDLLYYLRWFAWERSRAGQPSGGRGWYRVVNESIRPSVASGRD